MTKRKQQNEQNKARFRQAKQQHYQRVQQGDVEFADEPGMLQQQHQQQQQHQHSQHELRQQQRKKAQDAFNENGRHPQS